MDRAPRNVTSAAAAVCGMLLVIALGVWVMNRIAGDPSLKALQSDPMADATFAHTTLQREWDQKSGSALGEPVHAEVGRVFVFGGVAPAVLLDRAVAEAVRDGWRQRYRTDTGFIGESTINGVEATLNINVGGITGDDQSFIVVISAD